jgi:tetratricopeptide (TPR) repeat protein
VSPSGSCGLPGAGSELHLNCSTTGTYTVNLEVADADGNILGKAESSVSVSVRTEQTKPGKAPDTGANDKVRQAKQKLDAGQLDQAIDLVTQAVNLDSKHAEAGSLRNRWQNERQQVTQHLGDANRAMELGDLDKASDALANAKKLHPRYPPVVDAERSLNDRKKAKDAQARRAAQLADTVRQQISASQYEAALASVGELRGLDPAKAGTLAKEVVAGAKKAAAGAEQRRDFQQSGRLFGIAKQADPSDIEAARGVNNAPVYEQRMKEVRAWQNDARSALDRGDYDASKSRLYDIKNWESTLPGPLDKATSELQTRHDKEFSAYQKEIGRAHV